MCKSFTVLTLVLMLAILFYLPLAGEALTVSPAKTELNVNPGDSLILEFVVKNDSLENASIYPRVTGFSEDESGTKLFLENVPEIEWISLPKEILLTPEQESKINAKIDIPQNAPPGGHFLAVGFSTIPPKEEGSNRGVAIGINVVGLVYINVSGKTIEKASISNFELKKFILNLPLKFKFSVKNEGNTYIRPLGEIVIKNVFGQKSGAILINPRELQILPGKEKYLENIWNPKFAFGPYKINFLMNYGSGGSIHFEKWVFIASLNQIVISLVILLFLVFGVPALVKKYNKWVISKYSDKNKI